MPQSDRKTAAAAALLALNMITVTPILGLPSLENGLARTPPMGWNSWNCFQYDISEAKILQIAHALIGAGMRDAGYVYLTLDDGWPAKDRDARGDLQPNGNWPHGLKALGDSLHALGFKFGIYGSAGETCCSGLPGGWGHEAQDARQYARWGVDYLKYDWCFLQGAGPADFSRMRDALKAAGRPVLYSINSSDGKDGLGDLAPWIWGDTVANLWRTTKDIGSGFSYDHYDRNKALWKYAGPGHWNDPDMLQIGNGMSDQEAKVQFTLWCAMASPLIAGNDVRSMSAATRAILCNAELIAVDQDPLGAQGKVSRQAGTVEILVKTLRDSSRAVVALNRGGDRVQVTIMPADLGWPAGAYAMRDLWRKADLGPLPAQGYAVAVGADDVVALRIYKGPTTGIGHIRDAGARAGQRPRRPRFDANGARLRPGGPRRSPRAALGKQP